MTLRDLAPYRKNGDEPQVRPLTPEEIKQIDAEFVKWRKQWVDRRRMYKM
jgi:26S proteasome regulatory subunit (ATPase 3-interacting protein)